MIMSHDFMASELIDAPKPAAFFVSKPTCTRARLVWYFIASFVLCLKWVSHTSHLVFGQPGKIHALVQMIAEHPSCTDVL